MTNRVLFLGSVLIALLFSSCDFETKFESHASDLGFSIDVPIYMTATENLNNSAVAQFENQRKHTYLVIFKHSKREFTDYWKEKEKWDSLVSPLMNYSNSNVKDIDDFSTDGEIKHFEELMINGCPSTICKYEVTVESERVIYYTASVEDDDYFYTVMGWLVENEDKFDDDFFTMLNSFSILTKQ